MRKICKITSCALALCMLLSNGSVVGAEAVDDSWKDGDFWFRNCSGGVELVKYEPNTSETKHINLVAIPEQTSGVNVVKIGEGAFKSHLEVTSVRIPNTVIEIDKCAFENSGLDKVLIPESVKRVDVNAFKDCGNISGLYIMSPDLKITNFEDFSWPGNSGFKPTEVSVVKNSSTIAELDNLLYKMSESEPLLFETLYGESNITVKAVDTRAGIGPDGRVYCDANGDGKIDVADAQTVLKTYVYGLAHLPDTKSLIFDDVTGSNYCDITGDGITDISDAQAILRYAVYNLAGLDGTELIKNVSDTPYEDFTAIHK